MEQRYIPALENSLQVQGHPMIETWLFFFPICGQGSASIGSKDFPGIYKPSSMSAAHAPP
jgi:hypothetical protein